MKTLKDENDVLEKTKHFLYDKRPIANFAKKDQVLENHLRFIDYYSSEKYSEGILKVDTVSYMSDWDYETSSESFLAGIAFKKVDLVDMKQRMKLTKDVVSRILNQRKTIFRQNL